MIATLLALALAAPVAADESPAIVECPAPRLGTPRYPVDLARANKQGEVLVGARIDACGQVLETRIDASSGRKAFDESALAAVATYVLDPAQRAKAVDGWVQVPIRFGGIRTVTDIRKIPWPRSHRRPLYLADDQPLPFDAIADFQAAAPADREGVMDPPYASVRDIQGRRFSTSLRPDRADPSVLWFTYTVHAPPPDSPAAPFAPSELVAVARYRLVEEDGVPVVRIGLLCERPEDECHGLGEFLLKGLPFAKPRRR